MVVLMVMVMVVMMIQMMIVVMMVMNTGWGLSLHYKPASQGSHSNGPENSYKLHGGAHGMISTTVSHKFTSFSLKI